MYFCKYTVFTYMYDASRFVIVMSLVTDMVLATRSCVNRHNWHLSLHAHHITISVRNNLHLEKYAQINIINSGKTNALLTYKLN